MKSRSGDEMMTYFSSEGVESMPQILLIPMLAHLYYKFFIDKGLKDICIKSNYLAYVGTSKVLAATRKCKNILVLIKVNFPDHRKTLTHPTVRVLRR